MSYCLLSTAYWPPVQYFTKLILFDEVLIEQFETYPKQSYRNRMEVYGPNGIQSLQVPVLKASFKKTIIKDVEISYDTPWQKNHVKSIESAYRSSPFYEYYIDEILPLFSKKYKFLIELNADILKICQEILGLEVSVNFTLNFIADSGEFDFRNIIHPKSSKARVEPNFKPVEYVQGFEQRHGFAPNLSILDLIFNCGPESLALIKSSIRI